MGQKISPDYGAFRLCPVCGGLVSYNSWFQAWKWPVSTRLASVSGPTILQKFWKSTGRTCRDGEIFEH